CSLATTFIPTRRPSRPTLFPYTTLFRSEDARITLTSPAVNTILTFNIQRVQYIDANGALINGGDCTSGTSPINPNGSASPGAARSEEHTSELQSPDHLV